MDENGKFLFCSPPPPYFRFPFHFLSVIMMEQLEDYGGFSYESIIGKRQPSGQGMYLHRPHGGGKDPGGAGH
jgi:hypothetical protein